MLLIVLKGKAGVRSSKVRNLQKTTVGRIQGRVCQKPAGFWSIIWRGFSLLYNECLERSYGLKRCWMQSTGSDVGCWQPSSTRCPVPQVPGKLTSCGQQLLLTFPEAKMWDSEWMLRVWIRGCKWWERMCLIHSSLFYSIFKILEMFACWFSFQGWNRMVEGQYLQVQFYAESLYFLPSSHRSYLVLIFCREIILPFKGKTIYKVWLLHFFWTLLEIVAFTVQ